MAPHAVGTIDRNMMDQRAVCSGGALDAIYRANDRPHVLAAVLITACKGATGKPVARANALALAMIRSASTWPVWSKQEREAWTSDSLPP